MTSMIGADPDALDRLAVACETAANRLDATRAQLTALTHSSPWRGDHADQFRDAWDNYHQRLLVNVAQAVAQAATVLHNNANQQRLASGEPASGLPGSVIPTSPSQHSGGVASFLHRAEHRLVGEVHASSQEVRVAANDAVHDYRAVVGSKEFTEALGGLQIVSAVAGIVALLPIPGVDVIAGGIALGASGIVMEGHLMQMANSGHFDAGTITEDAVGVAGSSVGLGAAAKAYDAVQGTSAVWKLADDGGELAGKLKDADVAARGSDFVVRSVVDGNKVKSDLQQHDVHAAVSDTADGVVHDAAAVTGFGAAGDAYDLGHDGGTVGSEVLHGASPGEASDDALAEAGS